jgi:copper(I)-binding protein
MTDLLTVRAVPRAGLAFIFALALSLGGCARKPETRAPVVVNYATVRLPAVAGEAGAGYFAAMAASDDRLLAVTAPGLKVELHETMTAGGMTSMRPIAGLALPAGKEVRFAPGGKHLMIFGLAPGKTGTIPLTFRFQHAAPVVADARLVGAGELLAESDRAP